MDYLLKVFLGFPVYQMQQTGKTVHAKSGSLAAHDLTYVHQISRVMAHQYRQAVGLFCVYLGVPHGSGHSSH